MRQRCLPLLSILLVLFGAASLAHADIYRWLDAKGNVNVSNLPPPEGVLVTSVTKETPQQMQAAREASRLAEMQAMAQRIEQLEQQVQAPPPQPAAAPIVQVVPVSVPVVMQAPAPPVDYSYVAPQPTYGGGCDPSWAGCGLWNPWYYPSSIVVINNGPQHRRPAPPRATPFPGLRPIQGLVPPLRPMQAAAPIRRG